MKTLTYGNAHICFATAMLVSMMVPQIALSQSSDTITVTDDAHRITADIVSESGDIGSIVRDAVTKHPRIMTANTLVCQARYALDLAKAGNSMVITGSLEGNSKLIRVQTELAQAESRQAVLAGRVSYAEVKAPHDGTVSALHLKTIGAVVNVSNLLAEIVPAQSDMLVGAKLLPQDMVDVSVGQTVRVSLSAYDVSRYGSLEGVVKNIATNTTQEDQQPPYYETFISIDNPVFEISQVRPEVIPGMQVTVDIIGGKRTVLDYILSPIKRASKVAFREI